MMYLRYIYIYIYIYEYWIKNVGKTVKFVIISIFAIGVLVCGTDLLLLSRGWKSTVNAKKSLPNFLIQNKLKKGYATFWNAYSNEIYSDLKIEFAAVNFHGNNIVPYYWLTDSERYIGEKNKPSFILLTSEENEYAVNNDVLKQLGIPLEKYEVNGMFIYTYAYDIASKFMSNLFNFKHNDESEHILSIENLIPAPETIKSETALISKKAGLVHYGPYVYAKKGTYKVCVYYESNSVEDKAGRISVTANSGNNRLTYSELESNNNKNEFMVTFSNNESAVEIVCEAYSEGLKILGYTVQLVE